MDIKWVDTPPEMPGWYWFKEGGMPEIVRVDPDGSVNRVQSEGVFGTNMYPNARFAGPLPPPARE